MNMVAFDLGGSGAKVVLGKYDGKSIELETIHRFEHSPCPIGDGLYWDIVNIYNNMVKGLKIAIKKTGDSITSFGIDSFSNDFSFISKDGDLLSPVRSYRDKRTERYKKQIYAKMSPEKLYQLTGNQCANFNTLMQLGAMHEAGLDYVTKNAYKMLFTPDLLTYFLTTKSVSEYTISSVSQMFSFKDNYWNKEILDTFGLSDTMFGTLVQPGTVAGRTTEQVNALLGTKGFNVVSVCEHDTASAFLASIGGKESAIISSGTWALVGIQTDKPIINEYGMKYNVANEGGYPGHHRILRNVMGTWILQEIRAYYREKGQDYSFAEMEKLAGESRPFAYLIDVDDPMFFEPGDMPEKVQNFCRRYYDSAPQTVGEIVRCVYESLAMKYRWSIEILEHLTGKALSRINIIGGGSKDKLMCQLTANICGKPVLAGPAEATSYGNILVQLIAAGEIKTIEEGLDLLRASFTAQEYLPEKSSLWDEKYEMFKKLFHLN